MSNLAVVLFLSPLPAVNTVVYMAVVIALVSCSRASYCRWTSLSSTCTGIVHCAGTEIKTVELSFGHQRQLFAPSSRREMERVTGGCQVVICGCTYENVDIVLHLYCLRLVGRARHLTVLWLNGKLNG